MSVDVPNVPLELLPYLKQRPELSIFGTKTPKPPQSSPHPVPYRCELCPFETTVQQQYQNHMREHKSAAKDYPCPVCGKVYPNEARLQNHMLNHDPTCMYCEKRFKSQAVLQNHMKTHFPPNVNCNFCNKSFSTKSALKRHQQSVHGGIMDNIFQ